jgi:cytidylate kinase
MKTKALNQAFLDRIKTDGYRRGDPFVTVSREAGAGGLSLAEAVHDRTHGLAYENRFRGWLIYDQAICQSIAQDPNLRVTMKELQTEQYDGPVADFFNELLGKQSSHYTVAVRTFSLIKTLMTFGKVIIVGRAGRFVARDLPGGIHIRLVAPLDIRIQRMCKRFCLDPDEALITIKKQDKDRKRLIRDFFSADITDPANYDAVWHTGAHTIDELADRVIEMINVKHKELCAHC